jgi:hypothetical protein
MAVLASYVKARSSLAVHDTGWHSVRKPHGVNQRWGGLKSAIFGFG